MEKEKFKQRTLKHIDNTLTNKSNRFLNGYAIALEGWRRGLNLELGIAYEKKAGYRVLRYTLSDSEGQTYHFNSSMPSKVTTQANYICKNKDLTKEAFAKKSVPQAEAQSFYYNEKPDRIINYAESIGYPIVLKPNDGQGGNGVVTNIYNQESLEKQLNIFKTLFPSKTKILIEKQYTGDDYRFYVIDNQVIAAVKRIPANITGTGKHTIRELINIKNRERLKNKGPSNRKPINIDQDLLNTLRYKGLELDSIIPKDIIIYLKKKCNVSSGGETIDVTDTVTEEQKRIAVTALKAIEGLNMGAIDLLIDDVQKTTIVLEASTKPGIDIQMYPTIGKARDIPRFIIDALFPNTKNYNEKSARKMYFDFDSMYYHTCIKGVMRKVSIPNIPRNIELKKYSYVMINKNIPNIYDYLQRNAHKYNTSGILKIEKEKATLILAGKLSNIKKVNELFQKKLLEKKVIYEFEEQLRTLPVKQGFEILNLDKNKRWSSKAIPVDYR